MTGLSLFRKMGSGYLTFSKLMIHSDKTAPKQTFLHVKENEEKAMKNLQTAERTMLDTDFSVNFVKVEESTGLTRENLVETPLSEAVSTSGI